MFRSRVNVGGVAVASLAALALVACGTPGRQASLASPAPSPSSRATPSSSASPTSGASAAPSSGPTVVAADVRLVIQDFGHNQVRLARLDATDTAAVSGQFVAIVNDQVIMVSGQDLLALNRAGSVTKLGRLAGAPTSVGYNVAAVAVAPDLSRWLYAVTDTSLTSYLHLGTPTNDAVIATLPSPDGNSFYSPLAWNASGVYLTKLGTGLGGAGPFLDYRFPLAKLDLTSGQVTVVSPACIVYWVLDDGTMVCRGPNDMPGRIEIRSPTGQSNFIQLAGTGAGTGSVYTNVSVAPDNRRLIASRNGSTDPVIHYQMAVADLNGTKASAFGPLDFLPDLWLPDGRVVADHTCVPSVWGGGACDANQDGTYILSVDGTSHSLFFKLAQGARVTGYV